MCRKLIYINRFKQVLIFLVMLLIFYNSPALGSQQSESKTVLILYSFGHSYPATAQWDQGIRSVLETQQDIKININAEYLDLSRYNDPDYFQMMVNVLSHKYLKLKPDLIITVFEPAFEFVIKYGQELFPDVPVVFGGIEQASASKHHHRLNITGIFQEVKAYNETLEIALELHPAITQVVVVAGAGFMEQSWLNTGKKTFQQYEDSLKFTYLIGLPLDEIRHKVEKLTANAIVLYFPILEDNLGKSYIATETLSMFSEASNAPIYSFWDIFLGHGIVGGSLKNFQVQANKVAKMGIRILEEDSPENMSISKEEDLKYIFDWRQLKRWSIPETKLPSGSLIKYKEYSFWENHKDRIMLISALILFQAIIIGYLLVQRRIRHRAEMDAQMHREALTYVSRLVTLGELSASLAHELNQPLTAILSNAQAARRYLGSDPTDLDELNEILDDIIKDDKRAADIIKRLRSLMRKEEIQYISLDINEVIRGVAKIVNRETIARDVQLEMDLTNGLPDVQGNTIHLEQVVLNLILNGIEAMETFDSKLKHLKISTVKHDKESVRVSVQDKGTGIDDTQLASIFEAFYTTKSEGIGIGLSICRSIIEEHGGKLWAENNPDRGATISFKVPISKEYES